MERRSAFSRTIDTVQYENGIMEIRTRSGAIYEYHQVPEIIYRRFITSVFADKWYDKHIKNRFPVHKIVSGK